jgi:hypothetical protein
MLREERLAYLEDNDRLKAFNFIISGCTHIYSKGKLQEDKVKEVVEHLVKLGQEDPYFLAHFTSYIFKTSDSKDLKVLTTFANSLNDADGTPFSLGSEVKKPNLRIVSQAAVQLLDPKLVLRVIELANRKVSYGSKYPEAAHLTRSLKTAIKKYIRFRENNPKAIEGIKKVGLGKTFQNLYRQLHLAPSLETASILGWNQKKGGKVEKKKFFDFTGLSDKEIAEKIRAEKLPPTGVLGALPDKISPVIAVAVLEQASGDQAVILRSLFDSQGLLKNKEVKNLFTEKIKEAKTALDRVNKINTSIDENVSKILKEAKAEKRKEQTEGIGSVFIHIDISSSMSSALQVAKEKASIIAECISNPKENFHWGVFNQHGKLLKNPEKFEQDYFEAILYGITDSGSTDCFALYKKARELGATIDFYITDGGHNQANPVQFIQEMDREGVSRPESVVIVKVGNYHDILAKAFITLGIPFVEVNPEVLSESALVAQAIKSAAKGQLAIIDQIMGTSLLKLPEWWEVIKV